MDIDDWDVSERSYNDETYLAVFASMIIAKYGFESIMENAETKREINKLLSSKMKSKQYRAVSDGITMALFVAFRDALIEPTSRFETMGKLVEEISTSEIPETEYSLFDMMKQSLEA